MAAMALVLLGSAPLQARPHVARRLGHPSTRFADPLQTPEDLRERLTSPALRGDIATIVQLCDGWQGSLDDFREAAATAPIAPLQIPIGAHLPAMSSRRDGRPILVRDIIWGGTEPIDAYEFFFYSQGRRYRCVTPKACCNFWVENIGPDLRKPRLALRCESPDQVPLGRPLPFCLTLENVGEAADRDITMSLPLPDGVEITGAQPGLDPTARRLVWRVARLAPGSSRRVCLELVSPEPALPDFLATAVGADSAEVVSRCSTRVVGIPAVLFELIDVADPIEVGAQNTYDLSIVNQGSHPLTDVSIVCTLEDSQEFVTASGATPVTASGRTLTFQPLPVLAPKASAGWQVVIKALKADDVRFSASLTTAEVQRPIEETEATRQY